MWNKVNISIVIVVCVLCYIWVHRYILKRLFPRAIRSSSPRISPVQGQHVVVVEFFPDDDSSPPSQSGGLENSFIDSLPVFQYGKNEGDQKNMPVNAGCVICLGQFEKGEDLKLLPRCTHGFHVSCIDAWFQSHSNCPLCRTNVQREEDELLETLRREDFSRESDAHFQSVRSEILHNLANRPHTL